MIRRYSAALTASAALFFSLAGVANATLLVSPRGVPTGGRWQVWVDHSRVPTPRVRLPLALYVPRACGGVDGCAGGKPFAVYVKPTAGDARFALFHEIGHVFDALYLTPEDRRAFERLDGWDHGDGYGYIPWSTDLKHPWRADGLDPAGTPIEDFANTYASCAIWGLHPTVWYMNLWQGWDSGWASYRKACALIRRAASR